MADMKLNINFYTSFNNYNNRQLKYYEDLYDYPEYSYQIENFNFNPNDGVNTVVKLTATDFPDCDYAVCFDAPNTIKSRWYVIEVKRLGSTLYEITLRRDVLADKWDVIKEAPCFIEKATLTNDNPLIVNNENMSFNQIKTSETLLKDETNIPWIIGYYSRYSSDGVTSSLSNTFAEGITLVKTYSSMDEYLADIGQYETNTYNYYNGSTMYIALYGFYNTSSESYYQDTLYMQFNGSFYQVESSESSSSTYNVYGFRNSQQSVPTSTQKSNIYNNVVNNWSTVENYILSRANVKSANDYNKFKEDYDQQIIKIGDNYYRLSINTTDTHVSSSINISGATDEDTTYYKNNLIGSNWNLQWTEYESGKKCWNQYFFYNKAKISKSLIAIDKNYSYDISTNRNIVTDSPYDIFAIPYGTITINGTQYDMTTHAMKIVNNIVNKYGAATSGATLYDLQLLPYCPVRDLISGTNAITFSDSKWASAITYDSSVVGYIFNLSYSTFTFDINYSLSINNRKIDSQTDLYRLISPNYNGQFEFNLVKNNGLSNFNVDCQYKPYNPYIHVTPIFKFLYGSDFNDARGLICGGDFSLPIVNSAWTSYRLNNANYQQIFDRQIENMEINNSISNQSMWVNTIANTVSGGLSSGLGVGLLTDSMNKGIAGGVLGSIASGIAGGIDIANTYKLQEEAIDFKKDLFGYQLGNIKAMNMSLTKVSAFNNNNKIFPMIEYYTCTDKEKTALANKIKYNGMTVGMIDTISEYVNNRWSYDTISDEGYIKGQLIRLDNLGEDSHFASEIANEINKGVYTKWQYSQE